MVINLGTNDHLGTKPTPEDRNVRETVNGIASLAPLFLLGRGLLSGFRLASCSRQAVPRVLGGGRGAPGNRPVVLLRRDGSIPVSYVALVTAAAYGVRQGHPLLSRVRSDGL